MKLAKPEIKTTYIGMLLDDSASMSGVRAPTLSGFNEQLQVIQKMVAPDHNVYLTTAIFSEPHKFKVLRHFVDPTEVKLLTLDEYTTGGGGTALWDAMSKLITIMEEKKNEIGRDKNAALVQFFTDGQENASREVRDSRTIKARIEALNATDHWTFTYMGVGSIDDIVRDYGFRGDNVTAFKYGAKGAAANTMTNSAALMSYSTSRSFGETSSANLYDASNNPIIKTDEDDTPVSK